MSKKSTFKAIGHSAFIGYVDKYILVTLKLNPKYFTTGSMIKDNLFTLQYCIEGCYKLKRPLIVTCLDYSKAFDSIGRGK